METLRIEKSERTPFVEFKPAGFLTIEGRSIPEDSFSFYRPILAWLDSYSNDPPENTILDVKLEYFNTSSSKSLLEIFKLLEGISNHHVTVNWHYEQDDEDMLEAGEDYREIVDVNFYLINDL